jgi:hypothetical protein
MTQYNTAHGPSALEPGALCYFLMASANLGRIPVSASTRSAAMPRPSQLDKQWQELMLLCAKEKEFRTDNPHPKLLILVTKQIDELAADMGFSDRQIETREFRAERDGERILRALVE